MQTIDLSTPGAFEQAKNFDGTVIWRPDGKNIALLLEPISSPEAQPELLKKDRSEKKTQWWPSCVDCKSARVKKIPNSKLWQCSACGCVDFPKWEQRSPLYTRDEFEADMASLEQMRHRARVNLLEGKMDPWKMLKFEDKAEQFERKCKGKLLMTRTFLSEREK